MSESKNLPEKFVSYSAGSQARPWIGWLEDEAGRVTAFVALGGTIWREDETGTWNIDPREGSTSPRNAAWNCIRDAILAATSGPDAPPFELSRDYWPQSNVACILSLALKQVEREMRHLEGRSRERAEDIRKQIEAAFATAVAFKVGASGLAAEPLADPRSPADEIRDLSPPGDRVHSMTDNEVFADARRWLVDNPTPSFAATIISQELAAAGEEDQISMDKPISIAALKRLTSWVHQNSTPDAPLPADLTLAADAVAFWLAQQTGEELPEFRWPTYVDPDEADRLAGDDSEPQD